METYNRGQWGENKNYPDDITFNKNDIDYKGFDSYAEFTIGDEYGLHVTIHCSENPDAEYKFLAIFSTCNRSYVYLVTDFPSMLMFVKEVIPLFREERETEMASVKMEEHQWKSQDLEPHQYRKQCSHY